MLNENGLRKAVPFKQHARKNLRPLRVLARAHVEVEQDCSAGGLGTVEDRALRVGKGGVGGEIERRGLGSLAAAHGAYLARSRATHSSRKSSSLKARQ